MSGGERLRAARSGWERRGAARPAGSDGERRVTAECGEGRLGAAGSGGALVERGAGKIGPGPRGRGAGPGPAGEGDHFLDLDVGRVGLRTFDLFSNAGHKLRFLAFQKS